MSQFCKGSAPAGPARAVPRMPDPIRWPTLRVPRARFLVHSTTSDRPFPSPVPCFVRARDPGASKGEVAHNKLHFE